VSKYNLEMALMFLNAGNVRNLAAIQEFATDLPAVVTVVLLSILLIIVHIIILMGNLKATAKFVN